MRVAGCAACLVLVFASAAGAQRTSDVEAGKALFDGLCVTCHGFDGAGGVGPALNRPRLLSAPDEASLRTIIAEGIPNRGMPRVRRVDEDEMRQLVAYVKAIGQAPRRATTGSATRGAAIYGTLNCASCHVVNGKGGSLGPELSAIGWLRGPDYLRQAVLEPGARLPQGTLPVLGRGYSEFLPVTVVARDGGEVRGVRINEDVFTIQLRDAAGRVHSVRKSEAAAIRKQAGTSVMPGYASRLAAGEVDDLVAYLSSLGGAQ